MSSSSSSVRRLVSGLTHHVSIRSVVRGFNIHDPPADSSLDGAPNREDNIQPPFDVLERNGVRKLIDQHGGLEAQVGESHALAAHLE